MTTTRLSLISVQTATTYVFGAGTFGWANCTVNDATGELLITSDYGNWSHRWDPRPSSLGAPNLTAFIGTRDVDYLARKLQGGNGRAGRRWSAEATAKALRGLLCQRRLDDGRKLRHRREQAEQNAKYGVPIPMLTRDCARTIWDEIGYVIDFAGGSADLFYEHVLEIDDLTRYVTNEPWDHGETEQTAEDRALRDLVLPALIEACMARIEAEIPWVDDPKRYRGAR